MNNIADALLHLDRADEALEKIDESKKMNDSSSIAWETKSEILKKLGRNEEAQKCYEKAKELEDL